MCSDYNQDLNKEKRDGGKVALLINKQGLFLKILGHSVIVFLKP